jgi:hypothetical protein
VQQLKSGRVPFKQSEVPHKCQRTEQDIETTLSISAPSMLLFTFTQTLRDALLLSEKEGACKTELYPTNKVTDQDTTSALDEELEGMLPNPPTSGKVCVVLAQSQ